MSDAATLRLGFVLDYGTTQACRRSMDKESNCPQLAGKALDSRAGSETFTHGHEVRGLAVRAHLSCWAFWSGSSVIHIQGTISQHAAIQSFDCFLRLSVVCHFHECKPARQPSVTIHNHMNLHHLSVGFEQPPKLLVRHLRTQVSHKEVFHDVSPIGNCNCGLFSGDWARRIRSILAPFLMFLRICGSPDS